LILSHRYKFIFIKTRKTAGTSIEVFLSQCCGEDDVVTPILPYVEPHKARNYKGIWNPEIVEKRGHRIRSPLVNFLRRNEFYNHMDARAIRSRISREIWNGYFKFCVERNPWDKTLSHYHMVNANAGGTLTLDEYIDRGSFCINYPLYTDRNGKMMVDKVIRYESLISELAKVFDKLGIPFEGTLGVRAKSDYRRDRRPYDEVFDARQREVIEKAFSREIELHGVQGW
jgi:hypothetical protein